MSDEAQQSQQLKALDDLKQRIVTIGNVLISDEIEGVDEADEAERQVRRQQALQDLKSIQKNLGLIMDKFAEVNQGGGGDK